MARKKDQKGGGSRKHGRNKRQKDLLTSLYVRGKITFEKYSKGKNLKINKG